MDAKTGGYIGVESRSEPAKRVFWLEEEWLCAGADRPSIQMSLFRNWDRGFSELPIGHRYLPGEITERSCPFKPTIKHVFTAANTAIPVMLKRRSAGRAKTNFFAQITDACRFIKELSYF